MDTAGRRTASTDLVRRLHVDLARLASAACPR
ncbi:putative leader peptide [Kineococcus indalonis]|nr:putative leader peptide [Kineococcus indalonis]